MNGTRYTSSWTRFFVTGIMNFFLIKNFTSQHLLKKWSTPSGLESTTWRDAFSTINNEHCTHFSTMYASLCCVKKNLPKFGIVWTGRGQLRDAILHKRPVAFFTVVAVNDACLASIVWMSFDREKSIWKLVHRIPDLYFMLYLADTNDNNQKLIFTFDILVYF